MRNLQILQTVDALHIYEFSIKKIPWNFDLNSLKTFRGTTKMLLNPDENLSYR